MEKLKNKEENPENSPKYSKVSKEAEFRGDWSMGSISRRVLKAWFNGEYD